MNHDDDTFLTDPMTVPGQLDLLGDERGPVGVQICQHETLRQLPKSTANSSGYPCFYRCDECGSESDNLSEYRSRDLLGDECSPVGLARVNVPLDDTHSESLIQTRIIRSEFQQLRLEASRWTPGGPQ
jgi:hypothetical protein